MTENTISLSQPKIGEQRTINNQSQKRGIMTGTFPLAMAGIGEEVCLEKVRGGNKLLHRLTALGLTPGVTLKIIQDAGGPLLLSVRDSRIALGRGMAQRVMVRLKQE